MTYLSDAYVNDSQDIPQFGIDYAYPEATATMRNDGLTFTGVMYAFEKAPQSHAKGRTGAPGVPVWTIAAIFAGLVLMAIGWMLNEPVSWFLYGLIHGSTHA